MGLVHYIPLTLLALTSSGCMGIRINNEDRLVERQAYESSGVGYREPESSFEKFQANMLGRNYLVTNDPGGIFTVKRSPLEKQDTLHMILIDRPKTEERTFHTPKKEILEEGVIIIPGE